MITWRFNWLIAWAGVFALAVFLAAFTPTAQAANPFELDGNAVEGDWPGTDWDDVINDNVPPNPLPITDTGLIIDRPEPSMAQFHGGGSKDENNVPMWGWRSGTPPGKDDITNAYAAAFEHPDTGHFILVFGMDRYDTSGDAQLGFWFLQDEVQPVAGGDFSGFHVTGDILVLVNFSGGGDVPTINVFEWVGGGIVNLGIGGDVLCENGWIPGGQDFCGITNAGFVSAPWTYENKDVGFTNMFPPAGFFEGAIDLTAALDETFCFTNFLAESRSSTSINAILKDFATPEDGFNVCGISVTKNCTSPRLNEAEDMIIYDISGTVTNEGFGTLFDVGLSDSPTADGAFQWVDCSDSTSVLGTFPLDSLDGGAEACYLNTITVPLDQNGLDDTVSVTSNTADDGSGADITDSDTATCPNLTISPALSITKDCEDTTIEEVGSYVVVKVNISGEVCNVGDTELTDVAVTDSHVSGTLLSGVTLVAPDDPTDPGATTGACQTFSGSYYPSTANDNTDTATDDPTDVIFKDTAEATGKDIFGNSVTPATDMASCPLCP